MTKSRWHRWAGTAAAAGLVLAWAGILCRGRDTWVVPALCYYATPLDQIWHGPGWTTTSVRHTPLRGSDHRRIEVVLKPK